MVHGVCALAKLFSLHVLVSTFANIISSHVSINDTVVRQIGVIG